jgi:hypothetical protein
VGWTRRFPFEAVRACGPQETGLREPRLPTLVFRRWVGRVGGGAGSGPDQYVDGEERDLWRRVPGLLRGGQELLAGEVLELLL